METDSLKDQVVLVTGGNEGIGHAIAVAAARAGAAVAVFGREADSLAATKTEIESIGREAIALDVDVADLDAVRSGVATVIDRFGKIDGLVANAGINGKFAPIDELSMEDWQHTLDVNLNGTFTAIREVVPHMKQRCSGKIVVVSSINGTRVFSLAGASAYAVSKAGQVALAQMLALELSSFGIRVNVVCPGGINTHIHEKTERQDVEEAHVAAEYPEGNIPLTHGDMPEPAVVADPVVFLLSDAARHVSGTPLWIDGAQSLLE